MNIDVKREFISSSQANVSFEDIENIIKKVFGNVASVKAVEIAKYGDVNSCYIISADKSAGKLFLKVENHDIIPGYYSGQIEREFAGTELLKKYDFPCPNVIKCDISKNDIGKKYILTEFIEGQLLSEAWGSLTYDEKTEAKDEIIALIDCMEGINSPYFGDIYKAGNRGSFEKWNDAYLKLADILLKDCINAGIFNNNELETVNSAVLKAYNNISCRYRPCFNHMDIHGQNIFIDRTEGSLKIKAVIDFGNAMFGIPFTDEYRLKTYKFFKEDAYNCSTRKKYYFTGDELFAIEILFDLECLVFGGMMKYNWGKKAKVILKCEEYLV